MKDIIAQVGEGCVANADESSFGSMHKSVLKTIIRKGDKRRVQLNHGDLLKGMTTMVTAFADGRLLRTEFMLKGKTDVCKKGLPISNRINLTLNKSSWCSFESMTRLFDNIHAAQNGKLTVVLLDQCTGHWTDRVQQYALEKNVVLIKIPEGLTSLLQPLDVGFLGPMKAAAKGHFFQAYCKQTETVAKMTGKVLLKMRLEALDYGLSVITPMTVRKCFVKAFTSD
jgi:hypothetical protein